MSSAIPKEQTPLTFTFKNIGPIDNAELELGDLTIVAGRNNTGKTYLVYTLYGLLKTWEDWIGSPPPSPSAKSGGSGAPRDTGHYPTFEQICEQVFENGHAEFPVDPATLSRERATAMNALTRRFSENGLSEIFSSSSEEFEGASIGVKMDTESPCVAPPDQAFGERDDKPSIRYDGASIFVIGPQPRNRRINELWQRLQRAGLWRRYLRFLFHDLPEPFVLSAERFGISLFYRELDFKKSQLVDLLQKYKDKGNDPDFPFDLVEETVGRYALPIKDNIDYTRSIPDLRKQKSEVYEAGFFNDIKRLMNGYYAASSDAIEFRSVARGDRRFAIPLHLASSSVRGLSDLYFFLRHVARRNHLLIIDEPESHLDTANQVLLARLLARLVQAGLKVLLTTHSDYLVKEINNLLMLTRSFRNKSKIMRRLKYSRDDCIAPERIRAYVATNGGIVKCEIDKLGIDMPNFDQTINEINGVANELAIRVSEGSTD